MPVTTTKTKTTSGHYNFYPLQLTGIPISVSVAKAALSNIKGIKRVLRKESSWVQEDYKSTNPETGLPTYCLIGAKREVDGKGEHLTDTILQQCITGEKLIKEEALSEDFKKQFLEWDSRFNSYVFGENSGFCPFKGDEGVDNVQNFNDESVTIFADIHLFLDYCINQTQKLVAKLTIQHERTKAKKAKAKAKK